MRTLLIMFLIVLSCQAVWGEGTNEFEVIKIELKALKQEIAELRQEVRALKKEQKKFCGIHGHPSNCIVGSSDCNKRSLRK